MGSIPLIDRIYIDIYNFWEEKNEVVIIMLNLIIF